MGRSRLLRVDEDFYDYVKGIKKQSGLSAAKITKKMAEDKPLIVVKKKKR